MDVWAAACGSEEGVEAKTGFGKTLKTGTKLFVWNTLEMFY